MFCPPFVLRWINGLCYWILLSKDCKICLRQSPVGFATEAEAKADFIWWNAK
jgi:hypothetical protein